MREGNSRNGRAGLTAQVAFASARETGTRGKHTEFGGCGVKSSIARAAVRPSA